MKIFALTILILLSESSYSQNYQTRDINRATIIARNLFIRAVAGLSSELALIANYVFRIEEITNNPLKLLILDRIFLDEDNFIAVYDLFLHLGYENTIIALQTVINTLFESYYDVNNIPDDVILFRLEDYL
ncbi:hypothetical protein [Endozoicomonas numazuensis]|uniref:Uncharacterized protein n=1 Tax=Endozoicomonas numazuensis TaxID=1137799 RepID=A0A081NGJ0_9GAMM|nr:hypothetical protein [Endozoicomonas numazuensis]KEQ11541.1 hypothetical protein GZ78_28810 [Endozoicomonas numazuensis]KEQ17563.1 hypothetical protein GZ78_17655 [Endozoicomonas numazuensis]